MHGMIETVDREHRYPNSSSSQQDIQLRWPTGQWSFNPHPLEPSFYSLLIETKLATFLAIY